MLLVANERPALCDNLALHCAATVANWPLCLVDTLLIYSHHNQLHAVGYGDGRLRNYIQVTPPAFPDSFPFINLDVVYKSYILSLLLAKFPIPHILVVI